MRGSCTKFDRTKGYGFLLPNPSDDPTMPDVFAHASAIVPNQLWKRRFLLPGFNVEFDVVYDTDDVDQDRPRAVNVRVIAPVVIARQYSDQPKTGGPRS
jgi:cold shock CspA family protein